MKKVLFIHQNFPAQFIHLANFLKKSYHVQSMSYSNKHILDIPHHKCVCERGNTPNIHYLALELKQKHYEPRLHSLNVENCIIQKIITQILL